MSWPDDEHDESSDAARPPLPPDDRLWRHPSELGRFGPGVPTPVVRPPTVAPSTLALTFVAGLLVGAGVLVLVGALRDDEAPAMVVERVASPEGPLDPTVAAERALSAIVQVEVATDAGRRAGTGVVFRDDGHVLTTADLVRGADEISARLPDGRVVDGTVVGRDTSTDIAVVRLATAVTPTAVLGSAADLQPGERVIAAAGGATAATPVVTDGVVQALGVSLAAPPGDLHGLIATSQRRSDAGAGAVIVNQRGAVIGLVTGRRGARVPPPTLEPGTAPADAEGVLATPIELARHVADELITDGEADHPWLGIVPAAPAAGGAPIGEVAADGPAALAGLRADDVIVAVAGSPVTSSADLVVQLRLQEPGQAVALRYRRDGSEHTCSATLDPWPSEAVGI